MTEQDRRAALTRCRTGKASDEDRVTLATRKGDIMNGPLECQPCTQHPRRKLTVRWFWDVPEDGDHATAVTSSEPEIVRGCALCAKENQVTSLKGRIYTRSMLLSAAMRDPLRKLLGLTLCLRTALTLQRSTPCPSNPPPTVA